jgi:glutathione S-transferase
MTDQLEKLQLYHYNGCFYCSMVRNTASELSIELELRDIHGSPDHMKELVSVRGRRTVPVLRIESTDGSVQWMPDSRDIVHYLRQRAGAPEDAASPLARSTDAMAVAPWLLVVAGVLSSGSARIALVVIGLALVALRALSRQKPD